MSSSFEFELNPISNPISNPIANPSIASPSDNLISLSYSMPVFSVNLFGLYYMFLFVITTMFFQTSLNDREEASAFSQVLFVITEIKRIFL